MFLDVKDIWKSFGAVSVLRGIAFGVEKGEVVCVVGPSGGGKSTLLRCINNLLPVDRGQVVLDGEVVGYRAREDGRLVELNDRLASRQRAEIGMVFQQFNLFPHRTALENVIEGPVRVLGKEASHAHEVAMSLLERVGLAERARAYPQELSGGQQQRVAIARSLAMEPKLMLFDEATSALDPELVADVLSVMRDLATSGITMVVVTHEMRFARDVSDQVILMAGGTVVENTSPDKFFTDPKSDAGKRFLAQIT